MLPELPNPDVGGDEFREQRLDPPSISSRIARTSLTGLPLGSGSSQSR